MSIAIACWDLGFDITGFEIDEDYFKAGIERVERHKKQVQLFDPRPEANQPIQLTIE